jgi:hypothetical protein
MGPEPGQVALRHQHEPSLVDSYDQQENRAAEKGEDIRRLKAGDPTQKIRAELHFLASLDMLSSKRPRQNKAADGKNTSTP